LRANEHTEEIYKGSVKSFDTNQLASNSPIEDSRTEGACLLTSGLLLGIFDGHAGPSCSQVISKRIMRYIAASLVPPDILKEQLQQGAESHSFLKCINDKLEFVKEVRDIYEKSFAKYAWELTEADQTNFQMAERLENAFLRLDADISAEALDSPSARTMSVAMSGAVAIVAHIDGPHLHIANVGDCSAVMGTLTDTGQWHSKKLTNEHNCENVNELQRILSEHPSTERDTVIRADRLLGQLAPLRALGDFRYKWPMEVLKNHVVPQYGEHTVAPYYLTPPYLSAKPEITHHILTPKDRFLVLASDGLWDFMTPLQVVRLVGEHMQGKAFLQPLKLPKRDITLGELNKVLLHRK
jgi:pyruvate dehydrogenase phosphatase